MNPLSNIPFSGHLRSRPSLHLVLPILTVVWSDAVLTPVELTALRELFNAQSWLTREELAILFAQLDPMDPPSAHEIRRWQAAIDFAEAQKLIGNRPRLADIGAHVALHFGTDEAMVAQARLELLPAEEQLGMVPGEALFQFYPNLRQSITQGYTSKPSFSASNLQLILDGRESLTIQRIKDHLCHPDFAYYQGETLAGYRQQVLEWCQLLANHGVGALAYPKEYGGKGDMAAYFSAMETLSYHDLSMVVKFGVQFGLWGMSVYFLGTEKHHQKYLRDIGTLALPGCFAMTETNHGSNVKGIETTATYRHDSATFVIHTPHEGARKEYIGNAALHGRMATVFAKLIVNGHDYGVCAVVVPLRNPDGSLCQGVTIKDCGKKMGLNGVDNGVIYFDQVEVPKENLLDRFTKVNEAGQFESPINSDNRRFFTMLGTLVGGRIGIPRAGLSAAKSGLTIAIRYGNGREQFGPEGASEVPILNYRTHQRRLIPRLANAYALHFSLRYLTERFLQRTEEQMQEIEALAAGLKAWSTWNTTATLQECRECCGGKGYLSVNRLDDLKNDTDIFTTFEGDNTVLMQLVAKSRLVEFKKEFGSMNALGIINYLARQAATSLSEMNPIIVRSTDEDHLLDPEFHINAFRFRERDILTSAAKRLKRLIEDGMDSFDAFNVAQHHLVEVAFAFVDRVILEQFQAQVERTDDPSCRQVLHKLCQLFALAQIDQHKGWYLEQGYMEGAKTKAIRKLLNQLCWEVRMDALPLVDAFGIPDSLLAAPIATHLKN